MGLVSSSAADQKLLDDACRAGDLAAVRRLVEHPPRDSLFDHEAVFLSACYCGQFQVASYLCNWCTQMGIPLNVRADDDRAFHTAVIDGRINFVLLLLRRAAVPYSRSFLATSFGIACSQGDEAMARLLLEWRPSNNVSVPYLDVHSNHNLAFRKALRFLPLAQWLLQWSRSDDPEDVDLHHPAVFEDACWVGVKAARWLVALGVSPLPHILKCLQVAERWNHSNVVRWLVRSTGCVVLTRDSHNRYMDSTRLVFAVLVASRLAPAFCHVASLCDTFAETRRLRKRAFFHTNN